MTPVMVNVSAAEWEEAYARMREGGVSWVRFNIPWQVIETSEGATYNWTEADNRVRNATCQGLEVVLGFADTPFWASGVVNKLASPPQPEYLDSWRTFVTATIDRYGGQGSFWGSGQHCADGSPMPRSPARVYQAWNEPNVSAFWGGKMPSPSYYMRLLQAAKQAALASTSPNSQIMLGGLTGDHEGGAAFYLRRLYRQPISLQHNADIIDVHPYATIPNKSLALVEKIRKIINKHDRSRTPIWVTEIGWSSCKADDQGYTEKCQNNATLNTTELQQAHYLSRSYRLLTETRGLRLQRMSWFTWSDYLPPPNDGCTWCQGAGLINKDGTAKPAWARFQQLADGSER